MLISVFAVGSEIEQLIYVVPMKLSEPVTKHKGISVKVHMKTETEVTFQKIANYIEKGDVVKQDYKEAELEHISSMASIINPVHINLN